MEMFDLQVLEDSRLVEQVSELVYQTEIKRRGEEAAKRSERAVKKTVEKTLEVLHAHLRSD